MGPTPPKIPKAFDAYMKALRFHEQTLHDVLKRIDSASGKGLTHITTGILPDIIIRHLQRDPNNFTCVAIRPELDPKTGILIACEEIIIKW